MWFDPSFAPCERDWQSENLIHFAGKSWFRDFRNASLLFGGPKCGVVVKGRPRIIGDVKRMTRQQVLDLYFLDARSRLIDLAAFLDRIEQASGKDDFRIKAFRKAVGELNGKKKRRAEKVLLAFSDPTTKPIRAATTKAACGAWNG